MSERKSEPRTWQQMAQTHGLVVRRLKHQNGAEIGAFLQSSRCDVLHVLAAVTLTREMLEVPRSGVIVHHASMLPSCRGLFPFIWGRLQGEPPGQSFEQFGTHMPHGGPLLAQRESSHPRVNRLMLSFQVWMAHRYPELALDATQRLLAGKTVPARDGVDASYGGLPTRGDRLEFEAKGGRLSTWADLRLTLSLRDRLTDITEPRPVEEAVPASYRFPDVLPFRANKSQSTGNVIPMRPRQQVSESS